MDGSWAMDPAPRTRVAGHERRRLLRRLDAQRASTMFPRIVKARKKNKTYQYLVISESVRVNGKSTTRNIANLGNVEKIPAKQVAHLIDGLIRLFELETYALSEGIEIVESLEYGSIIFGD